VTDHLHVIFARLTEHLSVLDAASYKQVKSIYEDEWHESNPAFFNQESDRADHLYANGMPMSDKEKLISFDTVFGHNLTIMRYKTIFDDDHQIIGEIQGAHGYTGTEHHLWRRAQAV
jgi:hypothetical protein